MDDYGFSFYNFLSLHTLILMCELGQGNLLKGQDEKSFQKPTLAEYRYPKNIFLNSCNEQGSKVYRGDSHWYL